MVLVDGLGHNIEDLENPRKLKSPSRILIFLSDAVLVVFFSALIFIGVNFPSYLKIAIFRINPEGYAKNAAVPASPASPKDVAQLPDNSIIISKIGVRAPIVWDVGNSGMISALERGVAHLAGSAKPGEGKNIFLTGHSSNYWWVAGNYKSVFALLPELKDKDEILIIKDGAVGRYEVERIVEVKKSQVGDYFVTEGECLTIMTCVPVGTNLRRLLVIAKPVL